MATFLDNGWPRYSNHEKKLLGPDSAVEVRHYIVGDDVVIDFTSMEVHLPLDPEEPDHFYPVAPATFGGGGWTPGFHRIEMGESQNDNPEFIGCVPWGYCTTAEAMALSDETSIAAVAATGPETSPFTESYGRSLGERQGLQMSGAGGLIFNPQLDWIPFIDGIGADTSIRLIVWKEAAIDGVFTFEKMGLTIYRRPLVDHAP